MSPNSQKARVLASMVSVLRNLTPTERREVLSTLLRMYWGRR